MAEDEEEDIAFVWNSCIFQRSDQCFTRKVSSMPQHLKIMAEDEEEDIAFVWNSCIFQRSDQCFTRKVSSMPQHLKVSFPFHVYCLFTALDIISQHFHPFILFRSASQSRAISMDDLVRSSYVHPAGYESSEDDEDNNDEESEGGSEELSDEGLQQLPTERMQYNEDDGQGYFVLGMTFAHAKEAREAIGAYGVKFGYKLKINPNEPHRLRVRCENEQGCPFLLSICKDGKNPRLAVKTLVAEHKCFRHYTIPSATVNFIAKYFKNRVYRNPWFKVGDMKKDAETELKVNISIHKCKRAKKKIVQELDDSYKLEFGYLAAYAEMLKKSNPGSKAEIELCKDAAMEGKRVFRRMFIMFDACKRNWMSGCRPLIGLNGSFLKGVCKGQLLSAVGIDGNDQMVPIAWGVIDKESKSNWRWFLCWLRQELELGDGSSLTVISNMQKGLIDAINNVIPQVEHRWCARHIYTKWSKKWHGEKLKRKFWICAWSTFEEDFKRQLDVLGELSKKAAEDLMRYPPQYWCRAYFSSRCKSYMVDNNFTETFNAWVLAARHKPIISMLEDIRTQAMNKIKDNKAACKRWFNDFSPASMKLFQDNKDQACGYKVIFDGDIGYKICEKGGDKYTVFLDKQLCTCRVWELTGIPCPHGICALYHSKKDHQSYISKFYHKSSYLAAYTFPLLPVPDKKFMRVEEFQPIEPPPLLGMAEKPKKKRSRATNEANVQPQGIKLSRKGQQQSCGICHEQGHNRTRCPNKGNQENKTRNAEGASNSVSKSRRTRAPLTAPTPTTSTTSLAPAPTRSTSPAPTPRTSTTPLAPTPAVSTTPPASTPTTNRAPSETTNTTHSFSQAPSELTLVEPKQHRQEESASA
ncbi:hypothetical protein DITRI_Ditri06bG0162900 [Diplodiscus trichospermus]